ncbi:unnamed protein product, partial [Didymodactylos carnosus]
PYNRRLIWTIIRKMKEDGKCVVLTTHFLEEADVLSDRIAVMSKGKLQAHGTPDFLKKQTDFEYRLFIDKSEMCECEHVSAFVKAHVRKAILERESATELVYGIPRDNSRQISRLVTALEKNIQEIKINGYGISMTTIEEVFLK